MPQQITMGGACHNVTGHHVPTNQSANALISVHSSLATPTKPTAALYAPLTSEDMVSAAAGFNASRLVAGKPLYPLISRDDQHCGELEKWRQSLIEQLTQTVNDLSEVIKLAQDILDNNKLTIEMFRIQDGDNAKLYDQLSSRIERHRLTVETLKHLEIRSNQSHEALALLRPGIDKLYLIGHGGPGDSELSADPENLSVITAKELADQLAAGGLDSLFDDVRVIACFSADAELLTSFDPEALRRAAQTKVESHWLLGWLGYVTNRVEPFAQSLCNALKRAGFKQPEVSGYHGARVIYSTTHHYSRLSDTQEVDVRASSVRQVFTPTV